MWACSRHRHSISRSLKISQILRSINYTKFRRCHFFWQREFILTPRWGCVHFYLGFQYPSYLNPFPNKPWLLRVCGTCLLKTLWEKGEIARNEQFLLFPQCFQPLWRTLCHFLQIRNCRLQTLSVWKSLKFVVWERVKRN